MAINGSALLANKLRADQTSFVTASFAPTANRLVLATIHNWTNSAGPAATPTLSGCNLTWVQVATIAWGTINRTTLFRAMGASPTSGAVTIDFGAEQQGFCGWTFSEFTGIDQGGTHGSAAVVQSATNTVGGSDTTLTVTLAAFANASNGTFGAFWPNNSPVNSMTEGAGFTPLNDTDFTFDGWALDEWRADNDTSVDATWDAASNAAGVAIEIKAAGELPIDSDYLLIFAVSR